MSTEETCVTDQKRAKVAASDLGKEWNQVGLLVWFYVLLSTPSSDLNTREATFLEMRKEKFAIWAFGIAAEKVGRRRMELYWYCQSWAKKYDRGWGILKTKWELMIISKAVWTCIWVQKESCQELQIRTEVGYQCKLYFLPGISDHSLANLGE